MADVESVGCVAEIALAKAHVHLFVVIDGVSTTILRVRRATLDAHSLGSHIIIC